MQIYSSSHPYTTWCMETRCNIFMNPQCNMLWTYSKLVSCGSACVEEPNLSSAFRLHHLWFSLMYLLNQFGLGCSLSPNWYKELWGLLLMYRCMLLEIIKSLCVANVGEWCCLNSCELLTPTYWWNWSLTLLLVVSIVR